MTFSLRVSNGDLVLAGNTLGVVYGTDKLTQDLTLWMCERYGVDRFHPWYGSQFQNYIGGVISTSTQAMVYTEASRVLDNYQRLQGQAFQQAPANYSLSELLATVNNVAVTVNYDQVNVAVSVSNAVQQPTTISVTQGV